MDELGLEELAKYVNGKTHSNLTLKDMGECQTFGDVLCRVKVDKSIHALPLDKMVLPTVWMQEFRGALKANAEGLLDPGVGYSKEDKLFARLRRTWREVKQPFLFWWKRMSPDEQRRVIFQSSPLPLDDHDPEFPISQILLPGIHVLNLVGDGFEELVEQRISSKFADVLRADMDHARGLQAKFFCPEEWDQKVMLLESRQEVRIRSHKDEARVRDQLLSGQAIPGRLWAVYLAVSSSVQSLLCGVLDEFKRKQPSIMAAAAKSAAAAKQAVLCHACGKTAEKLQRCSQCKNRFYCSRECQLKDWPSHKPLCLKKSEPSFALKFESHEEDD